ncbi:MAG: hypothetical protein ACRCSK_00110, partial [Fusobacteriaceae bacterium]
LFNTLQDEGYVVTDGLKVKEYSNIQLGYFGRFLIGAEVKGFVVDVGWTFRVNYLEPINDKYLTTAIDSALTLGLGYKFSF